MIQTNKRGWLLKKMAALLAVILLCSGCAENWKYAYRDKQRAEREEAETQETLERLYGSEDEIPPPQPEIEAVGEPADWDIVGRTVAVSHGSQNFVIRNDGSLWGWGPNIYHIQGNGAWETKPVPEKIMDDVAAIAHDGGTAMAIRTDGTLWCWGKNYGIFVGNGSSDRIVYWPEKIMEDAQDIYIGYNVRFVIDKDNTLWGWGNNRDYKLTPDGVNRGTPVKVMEEVDTVSLGAGIIAQRTDGSLWEWGYSRKNPEQKIEYADYYASIELGGIAIVDGILYQWGEFDTLLREHPDAVLMDGATTQLLWKDARPFMEDAVFALGNYLALLALKSDGTLWGWGYNGFGQLGLPKGVALERIDEQPLLLLEDVAELHMGGATKFAAIKTDGSVWLWGNTSYGNMGIGYVPDDEIIPPTKVMDNVHSVYPMGYTTYILTNNGELWACGNNSYNSIGDGTTEHRYTPVFVIDDVKLPEIPNSKPVWPQEDGAEEQETSEQESPDDSEPELTE